MAVTLDETKYGELLSRYRPRSIRSAGELEHYTQLHENLCTQRSPSAEEEELIALLEKLIAQYEQPLTAELEVRMEPVESLQYIMEQAGLRQADLVDVFGSSGAVSEVLAGKRAISKAQARRLGERFKLSPGLFI